MSIEIEPKHCPKCGAAIPAEAPQGLCPKCLMQQASLATETGHGAHAKSAPPTREEVAAAFPQLEILELIGQGGMGFVFKARQPKLDRFVALKILAQSLAADPAFAERFTREGRVLARLNHPNIVTVHDFGQANGFFYLLMEFVDGVNLRQAMKVGRFTPAQALAVVPKICEALQFAHNEGILHRDIKPENILLDSKGRVKIADFGIAKLVGADVTPQGVPASAGSGGPKPELQMSSALTQTGKALGTPQYMAPEQLEHPQDVDHRADIYSLGVVFYEMLTGELPLGRFAPPSEKSTVDPRMDEVVLRTLEKERERRTQTAEEVKTQVETISKTEKPEIRNPQSEMDSRFSRMAIVGVCLGMSGMLALVLYAVIGDSNLLDEGPSNVLAALGALCLLVSTILGWVAVSQIRRPARRLHGMWLAVFDALLFPLLLLDGLLAFQAGNSVQTLITLDDVIVQLGIQSSPDKWFHWLAVMATALICSVLDTLIIWGVWHAVNKRREGVPLADWEDRTFGIWACAPLLVGTLGFSLLITLFPWQGDSAAISWPEGLAGAIGSLGLTLALVWGLISWRKRWGKVVVIATSGLFVTLIVVAAFLSFVTVPAKRARLQAAFGPVTEYTLPLDENGWTPLFDLDHNQPVPDPNPGDTAVNQVQHLAQLKKPGVAIHHDGPTHVIAVSGLVMHGYCDAEQWEQITDIDFLTGPVGIGFLSAPVTGPGGYQTCDLPDKLPLTVFFKTGACKLGLLQITGFTDHPRGVKIRYKLVQPEGALLSQKAAERRSTNVTSAYNTSPVMRGKLSEIVTAGGTLNLLMRDPARWQIDAMVAQEDVTKVETGQDVRFTMDAFPARTFAGRVLQVSNAPISVQNIVTYGAAIEINDADPKFRPGMTAEVSFIVAHRENALKIPNAALRFRLPGSSPDLSADSRAAKNGQQPGRTVWVVRGSENRKPVPVTIQTGISDGVFTEVTDGLKEGDRVVVSSTSPQAATPPAVIPGSAAAPSSFGPVIERVSATVARKGDIGVYLNSLGTVESSNSVMFAIVQDYCQEVIKKFDAHQALSVEAYDRQMVKRFGHGFLVGVDNRIDTETGTLKCRASLVPEGENLMVPGLFLNIRMLLEAKHGVTLVPSVAIWRDPQGACVWAIQPDQTVSRRHVQVGAIEGEKMEIQSGLSPGEVVVSDGAADLSEGQKVRYDLAPEADATHASPEPGELPAGKATNSLAPEGNLSTNRLL